MSQRTRQPKRLTGGMGARALAAGSAAPTTPCCPAAAAHVTSPSIGSVAAANRLGAVA